MQRFVVLCGLILCLAMSAGAQGPQGAGSTPVQDSGPAPRAISFDGFPVWQISVGYQLNRDNLTGTPFTTDGFSVGFTHFFTPWFGLDGQGGIGFGSPGTATTPPCRCAKSVSVGGGPRVVYRSHWRLEPWAHFTGGMDHFRFPQSSALGSNTSLALTGGGGVDYLLTPRLSLRAEADEVFTRFFSLNQRHFQVVTGLVINF
jgi:hypothetical protein